LPRAQRRVDDDAKRLDQCATTTDGHRLSEIKEKERSAAVLSKKRRARASDSSKKVWSVWSVKLVKVRATFGHDSVE
jgi:hypothetical protein